MNSAQKYYVLMGLIGLGIGGTFGVYVPWMRGLGLSQAEVLLVNATFWGVTAFCEVPTGMIADGRGRGFSLFLGVFVKALSGVLFFCATGLSGVLMAEALDGVGQAFMTGAAAAWLGSARDIGPELTPVFARGGQVEKICTIAGVLAAPLTILLHPAAFWLVMVVMLLIASVFVQCTMRGGDPEHPLSEWEALAEARAYLKRSGIAHWCVAVIGVSAALQWFRLGWAQVLTERLGVGWTGVGWLLIALPLLFGGEMARRAKTRDRPRAIALALACTWIPMLLFFVSSSAIVLLFVIASIEIATGFFKPLLSGYQQRDMPDKARATALSLLAIVEDLGLMAWSFIGVMVFYAYDLNSWQQIQLSWAGLATVIVPCALLLVLFRPGSS